MVELLVLLLLVRLLGVRIPLLLLLRELILLRRIHLVVLVLVMLIVHVRHL